MLMQVTTLMIVMSDDIDSDQLTMIPNWKNVLTTNCEYGVGNRPVFISPFDKEYQKRCLCIIWNPNIHSHFINDCNVQ